MVYFVHNTPIWVPEHFLDYLWGRLGRTNPPKGFLIQTDSKDYLDLHHMIPLSHHCTGKSLLEALTKGQLISKRIFPSKIFQNLTRKIWRISALTSKKWFKQKIKVLLLYIRVLCLYRNENDNRPNQGIGLTLNFRATQKGTFKESGKFRWIIKHN